MKRRFEKKVVVSLLSILLLIGILLAPLANAQEALVDNKEKNPEKLASIDIRIKIGPIKIRIHLECTNTGPDPTEELPWTFDCNGMCLFGAHKEGIFPSIEPEATVQSEPFFQYSTEAISSTLWDVNGY